MAVETGIQELNSGERHGRSTVAAKTDTGAQQWQKKRWQRSPKIHGRSITCSPIVREEDIKTIKKMVTKSRTRYKKELGIDAQQSQNRSRKKNLKQELYW